MTASGLRRCAMCCADDGLDGCWIWRARVRRGIASGEAAELVLRVVRHTRLRSLEKSDVADELVAHFVDALESGATIEQAITAFGDERTAAALIARAKRRNRPTITRIVDSGFAYCSSRLCFTGCWLPGFMSVSRRPSVNYVEQLNCDTLATPVEQRAWPIYFAAGRELRAIPNMPAGGWMPDAHPGSADWQAIVDWLQAHHTAIEQDARVRRRICRGLDSSSVPAAAKSRRREPPRGKRSTNARRAGLAMYAHRRWMCRSWEHDVAASRDARHGRPACRR